MPLPWSQMLAIFVYAMVSCLVINDAVKVAMIKWRVLNVAAKITETNEDLQPKARDQSKPETKAIMPSDLKSQITRRAYELYEDRGRKDRSAVQDWEQAEQEIRKDDAKNETNSETNN
jgi:hypothetical protein